MSLSGGLSNEIVVESQTVNIPAITTSVTLKTTQSDFHENDTGSRRSRNTFR